MPNFTHKISSKDWGEAYFVDETNPRSAVSEGGEIYNSVSSWISYYSKVDNVLVEELKPILENK